MTDGAAVCWRGISRTYLAGRGVAGGRQIGGAFVIAIAAGLVGLLALLLVLPGARPVLLPGETLSRATPTLVPDE
jgi:hypothetical protein